MTEQELEIWKKKQKATHTESMTINNAHFLFITVKNRIIVFRQSGNMYFQAFATLDRNRGIFRCQHITPFYEKNNVERVNGMLKEDYSQSTYTEFLMDAGILGKMLEECKNHETLQKDYEKEKDPATAYRIGESVKRYMSHYNSYYARSGDQDIDGAERDLKKTYHYMKENQLSTYGTLSDQQQERVNHFLHDYGFFAFSNDQLETGLKKLSVDTSQLVRLGAGGFLRKDKVMEYKEIAESYERDLDRNINDPTLGENFAYEMFYTELVNHEYVVSGSTAETLDCLGYTLEEVEENPTLKAALKRACIDAVNNIN